MMYIDCYIADRRKYQQHTTIIKSNQLKIGLKLIENVHVPQILSRDYLMDFMKQISKFKSLKNQLDVEKSFLDFKVSKITKYPYLYNSLKQYGKLFYPVVLDFDQRSLLVGAGRLNVLTRYFPEVKVDIVVNVKKDPEFNNIESFIEKILQNPQWKDIDDSIKCYTEYYDLHPDGYPSKYHTFCGYEFVKKDLSIHKAPYSKFTGGDYELWKRIHPVLVESNPTTFSDYSDLMDKIIFDNVDYAMRENGFLKELLL